MATTVTTKREEDTDEVITDFIDTTVYVGEVEDWEDHLDETEESEDEPEGE